MSGTVAHRTPAGWHDQEPISAGAWSNPINGFRGFAAVVVVVGHTFFATRIFPSTGVIHFISIIVPIFFVVSAYALYRPFMADHLAGRERTSATGFWWKRFLRIYPLYAVALTLYLILLPGVRPQSGRVIDYVKLYTFLQVYDPDLVRFSGIPAAWFICDEVVFYLMIPFLAMGAVRLAAALAGPRRAGRPREVLQAHTIIAVAMIIIGQVSRTYLLAVEWPGATSLPISNLDYYGFGILLGVASLREHAGLGLPRPVDWVRRRPWVALVVVAAGAGAMSFVANVAGTTQGAWEDIQRYGVYSVMVVPFMIVMCLGHQDRSYNRLFGAPGWKRLAVISLHVYLWHQLVLGGFDRYVTEAAGVSFGSRFTTGLVMCVGAVIVTVVWASIWQLPLDRPYRTWSRIIPRPTSAGPYPRWTRPALGALAVMVLAGGVAVSLGYGGSPIDVRGGVGLITVTSARPGDTIRVRNDLGAIGQAQIDTQGVAVLRGLRPGRYSVRQERNNRLVVARNATVMARDDHPDVSFYDGRSLREGMNQITTRDGTQLAAYVHLPGPAQDGPYPTVVEYSGYQIADPDITQPATAVARALGYATVGVNVRGSGCSGGAFEMLGDAQAADGYDVIETVARQGWARNGTVGLVGFSYGGLGALEVASTAPPSLNSVAALSVYGSAREAFHPGGLANSGFPVGWMQDLSADSQPAGTPWVQDRIARGDAACARNQRLHGQGVDLVERYLGDVPDDGRFDALSPATWARTVEAPVFLAAQLQDATIGTDLADDLAAFERASVAKLVLTNGTHSDAVAPQILRRMDQFLSLYAANEVPDAFDTASLLRKTRPEVDPELVPDGPDLPITFPEGATIDDALAIYEAAPPVEVLFESGNGERPEAAAASTSMTFDAWPPSESTPTAWFLAPGGGLSEQAASGPAADATFVTEPSLSGDAYNIEGSDLITNDMSAWRQPSSGSTAAWVSSPVATDIALVGSTEVDLWVRIDQDDADLQVTLTEVALDGNETLVQVGWRRVRDADPTIRPGTWSKVTIRLGPVGHLVRSGSRVRLIAGSPGGGQAQWSFYPPTDGAAVVEVGQAGDRASTLRLPTIEDVDITAPAPGCGDLRGQPCRAFETMTNDEGAR